MDIYLLRTLKHDAKIREQTFNLMISLPLLTVLYVYSSCRCSVCQCQTCFANVCLMSCVMWRKTSTSLEFQVVDYSTIQSVLNRFSSCLQTVQVKMRLYDDVFTFQHRDMPMITFSVYMTFQLVVQLFMCQTGYVRMALNTQKLSHSSTRELYKTCNKVDCGEKSRG